MPTPCTANAPTRTACPELPRARCRPRPARPPARRRTRRRRPRSPPPSPGATARRPRRAGRRRRSCSPSEHQRTACHRASRPPIGCRATAVAPTSAASSAGTAVARGRAARGRGLPSCSLTTSGSPAASTTRRPTGITGARFSRTRPVAAVAAAAMPSAGTSPCRTTTAADATVSEAAKHGLRTGGRVGPGDHDDRVLAGRGPTAHGREPGGGRPTARDVRHVDAAVGQEARGHLRRTVASDAPHHHGRCARRAAATAWFAPLPPGSRARRSRRASHPARGWRSTVTTWSTLSEPTTTTVPVGRFTW